MQDGLYVALSAQIALEKRLTTIADNVANMSTVGFRATEVKFEDVVAGVGQNSVSFASPGDTYLSAARPARLRETGARSTSPSRATPGSASTRRPAP